MKKLSSFIAGLTLISMLVYGICGCSKQQGTAISDTDKKAFGKAIAEYCRLKNMGMVVKSFVSADIKDNKATVTCRMAAADGPGLSVKWIFEMNRENDTWKVTAHSR